MLLAQAAPVVEKVAAQSWWSEHSTLVVGVVGIVVSGFVGPTVTALLTARRDRAKEQRAFAITLRDDLRVLVDEAADLLGRAVSHLRLALRAEERGEPPPPEAGDSIGALFPLGQRLRLRLAEDDPVVTSYDKVRGCLLELSEATGSQAAFDAAIHKVEMARASFLDAARVTLSAPISEGEAQ